MACFRISMTFFILQMMSTGSPSLSHAAIEYILSGSLASLESSHYLPFYHLHQRHKTSLHTIEFDHPTAKPFGCIFVNTF